MEALSTAMEQDFTGKQRNVIVLPFQCDFSLQVTVELVESNRNALKALLNRGMHRLPEAVSRKNRGK